jgi:hypothetical protein
VSAATRINVWLGAKCSTKYPDANAPAMYGIELTMFHSTLRRPDISCSCPIKARSPQYAAVTNRNMTMTSNIPVKRLE